MNFYQKRKIKDFFIKHRRVLIGTGAFLLTGITVMLIGFAISGWSIVRWFKDYGITFCVIFGTGAILLAFILYLFRRRDNKRY